MREENHNFRLVILDPIYPPSKEGRENENEVILDLMKRYAGILENIIRQFPTQWLMFREFWVDKPPRSFRNIPLHPANEPSLWEHP